MALVIDFVSLNQKRIVILVNTWIILDKEIDKMVYELYKLTPEEIQIVEAS